MNNILGKRIASLREEKGLTQIELAKQLNISNTTLSQYEAGNRTPGNDILKQIADYFEVSLDYLLGRVNYKNIIAYTSSVSVGKDEDASKYALEVKKIDPDLFIQMCRATYLPEEDRKKIREYSAMLLEKHLREAKGKGKEGQ